MRWFSVSVFVLSFFLAACVSSKKQEAQRVPASVNGRPPQFVLLAFDGSKSLDMWKETRTFAKETGVKFTYFISGVYFIPKNQRKEYKGPGYKAGVSHIGFGDDSSDIRARLNQVSAAVAEGHEIASHANGHFDGGKWSEKAWRDEFAQFDKFLIGSWNRVGAAEPDWWFEYLSFYRIGFRAPLLGHSPGMWPALTKFNFKYDTSKVSNPNYWPQKHKGVWNFPLASVRRHGTKYKTLSMDYNFYYSHSKGKKGNPALFGAYEKEMYNSYLKYFKTNYVGNRAPIHIGHHFSLWNGGAYWRAMRKFAKAVCHLPEVYCVTYKDLYQFMEANKGEVGNYQAGNFRKFSAEEASAYMGPDLMKVSMVPDGPLDETQVNDFLKYMKDHSPEQNHE